MSNEKQKIIVRRFLVVENIKQLPTYSWIKANNKIYFFENKEKQLLRLTESNALQAVFGNEIDSINESKNIEVLEPIEFLFEQKIVR